MGRLYLDSSSFTDLSLIASIASDITSRLRGGNSPSEEAFDEFSEVLPVSGDDGVVGEARSVEVSNFTPERDKEERPNDCLRLVSCEGGGVGELVMTCWLLRVLQTG